jgi:hypothetical protein
MYTQDWDYRPPPPAMRMPDNSWQTWPQLLKTYVPDTSTYVNPANPVTPFASGLTHPTKGYPIPTSYALNRRVWGVFSAGPFPMDNLELPARTVLFLEAGPMGRDGRALRSASDPPRIALLDYGDTTDRVQGLCPYPTSHGGKMAVVAADGHAVSITVEHYAPNDPHHDRLYGRLGGTIFNWNGGYLNGRTDLPPRE